MTRPVRLDRDAVDDAIREMVDRERARVDDPGASIPGADPHDSHGWHANTGVRHAREPGMPLFHPEAWRFFRLLDVGWIGDDPLIGFAWDELGTPNLHYLTRMRFMASALGCHPDTLALNVRMHLRYLLAPADGTTDGSGTRTASWRQRCARLWLGPDQVLVGTQAAIDQQRLDAGWELPWPSLTNPPCASGPAPNRCLAEAGVESGVDEPAEATEQLVEPW